MNDVARSADGIPLHFEVEGRGTPALVFVHGWSCDRSYWSGQVAHFAEQHQVVTIDLAGHGESGDGRREWTMPAFGGDVVAVIEQLELREVVLIGHSMGGDVIVEVALALPELIAGIVWVDTYSTLGEPSTPEELERFVQPFREDFVPEAQSFVRRMFVTGSNPDLVARVVAVNPDYRPNDVEALARHGVEAVLMPGVGHFLMMEDPGTFNRLLGEAIEEFAP